jgi:hypothetical protein
VLFRSRCQILTVTNIERWCNNSLLITPVPAGLVSNEKNKNYLILRVEEHSFLFLNDSLRRNLCYCLILSVISLFVSYVSTVKVLLSNSFLVYFPKVNLCNLHPVCLCISLIKFWMPKPIFMKLGMQINAKWAHLDGVLNKLLLSVCVSLLTFQGKGLVKWIPSFGARQRLGKHVPMATNTRYKRRNVGRVILYAVCVSSKKSLWSVCVSFNVAR